MRHILIAAAAALMTCACSSPPKQSDDTNIGTSTKIEGDSTLYGLACEGCTDSVLVFLPGSGGDPVTYDIIDATLHGRVIGKPKTGDWVAVVLDSSNPKKGDMVINLDELKGQWVELVHPTLRDRSSNIDVSDSEQAELDSLLRERMKPIEMGFALKRHYVAQPIGTFRAMSRGDDDPVVFPVPKRYIGWHIYNGQLVLQIRPTRDDSLHQRLNICDTAQLLLLTRDSLRLRFSDGPRGYYRKADS